MLHTVPVMNVWQFWDTIIWESNYENRMQYILWYFMKSKNCYDNENCDRDIGEAFNDDDYGFADVA